ncbi:protein spinster homolog 1-like [Asterias amurensis]|uniref:protein spinster homolog 1-like n=1 Tax=Asterias amurensis TaxID=7602 RepID=UPI003AB6B9E0
MPLKKDEETEPLLEPLSQTHDPNMVSARSVIPHEIATSTQPGTSDQQPIEAPGARAYAATIILFLVNLLNYVDRFTIAANLQDIQKTYNIADNNSAAGLVQTIFIVGYMVTSPVFGYLGDRYPRKIIMSAGILFWAAMTLSGSFIPADQFGWFVAIRGLVGVGEASYSTIACTLIGDLFIGNRRTQMLMLFYFAIPVGSGLGYIAGKGVADAFSDWRWALRITPGLGVWSVIAIMVIIKEPRRGQAETGNRVISSQSYLEDLKALLKNKTYMCTTLGFTSIAWVVGALALWMVKLMELVYKINDKSSGNVSFIFGALTCAAGVCGVSIGTMGAQFLRRYNSKADTLVCALGNLLSAPFLYFGFICAQNHVTVAWVCVFFGETCLFLNWALVPDILMYVLIPVRRSTGNGMQMLSSHLLGDALSPLIIGAVSDKIRGGMANPDTDMSHFTSLSYSVLITTFISVIGGGFFLASSLFVEEDKQKMQDTLKFYQEVEENPDVIQPTGQRHHNPDVII